ncbi:MAG: bifunctional homocysteine S-methyltransferase/methylenetetrahydrofolate reductase [Deltaproteobacteria bacterium]|nr:bifunctional homocysteine S-methyltransferase/methylenetetrahydrofolate reductase [Deltaproteobacteria bacterium]
MANSEFLTRIQETVLIGDGGMGTVLYEQGVPVDSCFENLNLTHPHLVTAVHQAYRAAGAQLLETNTFTANRARLAAIGLEADVHQINAAGARLARQAAGCDSDLFIAGAVGPLVGCDQDTLLSVADQQQMFREQMEGLADGGVDLFLLETFASLAELKLAISVAKKIGLPVVAQMTFFAEGRTREGLDGAQVSRELDEMARLGSGYGADVVGANCGSGPHDMLAVVRQMGATVERPISAFANSGFPQYVNGRHIYLATPEYFAQRSQEMVASGASLVGGCCGTTPEHIAALAQRLKGVKPVTRIVAPHVVEGGKSAEPVVTISSLRESSPLLKHDLKRKPITVELDPPRGLDCTQVIQRARQLAASGVDAINLAENPLARIRMGNLALAARIQDATGVPVIAHVTCRDRNLIGLHSEMMGAHLLGLRHILAVTGDPASVGDGGGATSVFDLNSVGLLELLTALNHGRNLLGADLASCSDFCIGAAFNPNAAKLDGQLRKLDKKIAAGAQFVQTQPVYSLEIVDRMNLALRDVSIPAFLGILPLVSERNAEFLHNEVPGIVLPDEVRERMRGTKGAQGVAAGMEIAVEMVSARHSQSDGYYIMPPFGKVELAQELIEVIRSFSP